MNDTGSGIRGLSGSSDPRPLAVDVSSAMRSFLDGNACIIVARTSDDSDRIALVN